MCGIAGKVSFGSREISAAGIQTMADQMVCRGPDGGGVWIAVDRRAGLSHRRLSVIDLDPRANQPMTDDAARTVVTFNGEIYNFRELRDELGELPWRTTSDTEVLLELYRRYGLDRVEPYLLRLSGMFAFALWDDERKALLLARDPIGKKPLYYSSTSDGFVFASTIKALLTDAGVSREPNDEAIDLYLSLGFIPAPLSAFRAISKLQAGHFLVIDRNGVGPQVPYWSADFSKKSEANEVELSREILTRLQRATERRMISDVPLGAFLSGGIDSAAVVACMSRISTSPVKTFSVRFSGSPGDETEYARIVAERFSCDHTTLDIDIQPDHLPEIVRQFEEPFGDPAAIPTYFMSQAARRHVTVVLNGDGGDEDFAGYNLRHQGYVTAEQLPLQPLARAVARGMASMLPAWRSESSLPQRFTKSLRIVGSGDWHRNIALMEILTPAERRQLTANGTLAGERILSPLWKTAKTFEGLDRELFFSFALHLPEQLLVKVDRASMAWSLEARSPLLDREFVEFCGTIPAHWKLRGRRGKYIFREALRPLLPEVILDRPKQGFIPPLGDWLRGPLSPLVRDVCLTSDAYIARRYRPEVIRRIAQEHLSGVRNHERRLYSLLNLEIWAREFLPR